MSKLKRLHILYNNLENYSSLLNIMNESSNAITSNVVFVYHSMTVRTYRQ